MKRQSYYFDKGVRSDIPVPELYPKQDGNLIVKSMYMPHALELDEIMEPGDSVLMKRNIAKKVKRCLNNISAMNAIKNRTEPSIYIAIEQGSTDEVDYWTRIWKKS